jgi:hypothetical protein
MQSPSRIETIESVPKEEALRIVEDFRKAGAIVETIDNNDGTFSIQAIFTSESMYPASGIRSL